MCGRRMYSNMLFRLEATVIGLEELQFKGFFQIEVTVPHKNETGTSEDDKYIWNNNCKYEIKATDSEFK
jgi:hypothetical protein